MGFAVGCIRTVGFQVGLTRSCLCATLTLSAGPGCAHQKAPRSKGHHRRRQWRRRRRGRRPTRQHGTRVWLRSTTCVLAAVFVRIARRLGSRRGRGVRLVGFVGGSSGVRVTWWIADATSSSVSRAPCLNVLGKDTDAGHAFTCPESWHKLAQKACPTWDLKLSAATNYTGYFVESKKQVLSGVEFAVTDDVEHAIFKRSSMPLLPGVFACTCAAPAARRVGAVGFWVGSRTCGSTGGSWTRVVGEAFALARRPAGGFEIGVGLRVGSIGVHPFTLTRVFLHPFRHAASCHKTKKRRGHVPTPHQHLHPQGHGRRPEV